MMARTVKRVSEEARCDALIAQLFSKDAIVRFGRRGKRTTGTPGVPDRGYFVRGTFLWWEVKEGHDRLSPDQEKFLRRMLGAKMFAACGNADDLRTLVTEPLWRSDAELLIDKWEPRVRER